MRSRKDSNEVEIKRLREEIDKIDEILLQMIAKRKDVALEIAKFKQKVNQRDDDKRLNEIIDRVREKAMQLGLDEDDMANVWKSLIDYMIKEQKRRYPY